MQKIVKKKITRIWLASWTLLRKSNEAHSGLNMRINNSLITQMLSTHAALNKAFVVSHNIRQTDKYINFHFYSI